MDPLVDGSARFGLAAISNPPIRARVKPPEGCFPGAEKSINSKMTQLSYGHSMW